MNVKSVVLWVEVAAIGLSFALTFGKRPHLQAAAGIGAVAAAVLLAYALLTWGEWV